MAKGFKVNIEVRNIADGSAFYMRGMEFKSIAKMHDWFSDRLNAIYLGDSENEDVVFFGGFVNKTQFIYIVERVG